MATVLCTLLQRLDTLLWPKPAKGVLYVSRLDTCELPSYLYESRTCSLAVSNLDLAQLTRTSMVGDTSDGCDDGCCTSCSDFVKFACLEEPESDGKPRRFSKQCSL